MVAVGHCERFDRSKVSGHVLRQPYARLYGSRGTAGHCRSTQKTAPPQASNGCLWLDHLTSCLDEASSSSGQQRAAPAARSWSWSAAAEAAGAWPWPDGQRTLIDWTNVRLTSTIQNSSREFNIEVRTSNHLYSRIVTRHYRGITLLALQLIRNQ